MFKYCYVFYVCDYTYSLSKSNLDFTHNQREANIRSITSNKDNNVFYSYDKLVAGSAQNIHRLDDKETNKTKHIVEVFFSPL